MLLRRVEHLPGGEGEGILAKMQVGTIPNAIKNIDFSCFFVLSSVLVLTITIGSQIFFYFTFLKPVPSGRFLILTKYLLQLLSGKSWRADPESEK